MAYRILLVEDEADFREPLAILLSQDGYNVQAAVNGQEALEGLAGQSYDIIVSDLRMPGIDGEQLFRRIEREWPHLASRVVIMTAERPTRGFLGQQDGALVPILHKPFTSEHLEEVIASVIARDGESQSRTAFDSLPRPQSIGEPTHAGTGSISSGPSLSGDDTSDDTGIASIRSDGNGRRHGKTFIGATQPG